MKRARTVHRSDKFQSQDKVTKDTEETTYGTGKEQRDETIRKDLGGGGQVAQEILTSKELQNMAHDTPNEMVLLFAEAQDGDSVSARDSKPRDARRSCRSAFGALSCARGRVRGRQQLELFCEWAPQTDEEHAVAVPVFQVSCLCCFS